MDGFRGIAATQHWMIAKQAVLTREDKLRGDFTRRRGVVEHPALAHRHAEPPGEHLRSTAERRVIGNQEQ